MTAKEIEYQNFLSAGLYHRYYHLPKKSYYDSQKEHGLHQLWFENGQIAQECNYISGDPHGIYRRWYDNGQLRERCSYVNGKLEGVFVSWHPNGQLELEEH